MPGTTPSDRSSEDAPSRRDRLARRRSRNVRVIVAALAVMIVVALGIGAYALTTHGSQANAAPPDTQANSFGARGSLAPVAAIKKPAPRTLDHEHPLQLYVGGDSLAGSFGPSLGDQLGALGIVRTLIDFKVSSGLWSNDFRNWDAHATTAMAADSPEAVVFIMGTNDTPVVNQVDANGDGVPDWEAIYRVKVAKMMDILVGPNHRPVIWLGPPTLPDSGMNRGALAMGEVMREEAAKRPDDVVYVDTYKLFASSDGGWSRTIQDEKGDTITARISDGVHFTESGARYLARAVFSLLDARWHLTQQADLLHPIGWNFAPGSVDAVPGYRSKPTSRYHSGSSSGSDTSAVPVSETTTFPETPTSAIVVATTVVAPTVPPTVAPTTTPVATAPPTSASPTTGP